MVSTGPSWPTFNVWNQNNVQTRLLFLERERIDLPRVIHCGTREEARARLQDQGLL